MIRADFYRRAGSLVAFSVRGHSGLASAGYDIVCAAVSALTQGALIGLEEVIGINISADINEVDGRLECRLPEDLSPKQRREADVVLETLLRSLRSVEAGYGDAVRVREHRS